ncbi:helix-turn-helix domain-containing protein (plasmid) [Streptomyces sp. CWNU-52B]|uniref:helix-turn-helix domain-containing protein n=1 Tax=unclassified Streptomyces TaxID=2593676 RepID=UPI0039C41445
MAIQHEALRVKAFGMAAMGDRALGVLADRRQAVGPQAHSGHALRRAALSRVSDSIEAVSLLTDDTFCVGTESQVAQEEPGFQRARLRDRLRKAREGAGLKQREVAEQLDWSPSKVIRIEAGTVGVSVTDVRVLLNHYGITDQDQVKVLIDIARAARQPPWWGPYRTWVSQDFETYLGYESSASIIRNFEPNVVPGLLQTEEYAHQLMTRTNAGAEATEQLVQLRVERQDRLVQTDGPEIFCVLDEAVIRRTVGSPETMRRQYEKLLTVNEMPNVTVLTVPFSAGIYRQFRSPYVLFEFPGDEDEMVAYLESADGEVIISEKALGRTSQRRPTDYLDDFWEVERGVATEVTREFLFGQD